MKMHGRVASLGGALKARQPRRQRCWMAKVETPRQTRSEMCAMPRARLATSWCPTKSARPTMNELRCPQLSGGGMGETEKPPETRRKRWQDETEQEIKTTPPRSTHQRTPHATSRSCPILRCRLCLSLRRRCVPKRRLVHFGTDSGEGA